MCEEHPGRIAPKPDINSRRTGHAQKQNQNRAAHFRGNPMVRRLALHHRLSASHFLERRARPSALVLLPGCAFQHTPALITRARRPLSTLHRHNPQSRIRRTIHPLVQRKQCNTYSPRSSRNHFWMPFLPFPIPGFPIPRYFSNGLSSRTAVNRAPAPSSSKANQSPARTPNRRRISSGIVTRPPLSTFAFFRIALPQFLSLPRLHSLSRD